MQNDYDYLKAEWVAWLSIVKEFKRLGIELDDNPILRMYIQNWNDIQIKLHGGNPRKEVV